MELRNNISRHFGAELPATLMFDHPTTGALATYLTTRVLNGPAATHADGDELALSLASWEDEGPGSLHATELVAMSARLPNPEGAASGELWPTVRSGLDVQGPVPLRWVQRWCCLCVGLCCRAWALVPAAHHRSRWDIERYYTSDTSGERLGIYARFGAFCANVDFFDAGAFRLPGAETTSLDPQVRLLMEETAEAWTAAGPSLHAGGTSLVGVYVGCMNHEYLDVLAQSGAKLPPQVRHSSLFLVMH